MMMSSRLLLALAALLTGFACRNITVHHKGEMTVNHKGAVTLDRPGQTNEGGGGGVPLCDPICRLLLTSQTDRFVLDVHVNSDFTSIPGGGPEPHPKIMVQNNDRGMSCQLALTGGANETSVWQPSSTWFVEVEKPTAADAKGWTFDDGSDCLTDDLFDGLDPNDQNNPVGADIEVQTSEGPQTSQLSFESSL